MWRVRMMRVMWMVRMMRMVVVRRVVVRIVRMVVVVVVVRRVAMEVVELAATACAHAERRGAGGPFGVGFGGSVGGGLDEQGCA